MIIIQDPWAYVASLRAYRTGTGPCPVGVRTQSVGTATFYHIDPDIRSQLSRHGCLPWGV